MRILQTIPLALRNSIDILHPSKHPIATLRKVSGITASPASSRPRAVGGQRHRHHARSPRNDPIHAVSGRPSAQLPIQYPPHQRNPLFHPPSAPHPKSSAADTPSISRRRKETWRLSLGGSAADGGTRERWIGEERVWFSGGSGGAAPQTPRQGARHPAPPGAAYGRAFRHTERERTPRTTRTSGTTRTPTPPTAVLDGPDVLEVLEVFRTGKDLNDLKNTKNLKDSLDGSAATPKWIGRRDGETWRLTLGGSAAETGRLGG